MVDVPPPSQTPSSPPSPPPQDSSPSGRPPVDPTGAASPPPPPPGYAPPAVGAAEPTGRRGGLMSKFLGSTVLGILLLSILINVYMGVLVYRMLGVGPTEAVYQKGESLERIVIVPVEGLIAENTYDFVRQALRKLRDDPPAAIVLRVESPGGGVGASDRALGALKHFRQHMADQDRNIPVIASFGSYAASGGYYVAMASDEIYAEPTTITGSIGVIAQAFIFEDMMDKLGVTTEIITSTDSTRKDMLGTFRRWNDDDREKLRHILDNNYEQFIRVVHEGRRDVLDEAEVRSLATGEVFTADAARENRLIDEVGYLANAIDAAAAAAGIDVEPHVTLMRPPGGRGLLGLITGRSSEPTGVSGLDDLARRIDLSELSPQRIRDWLHEAGIPRMMYLAPIGE